LQLALTIHGLQLCSIFAFSFRLVAESAIDIKFEADAEDCKDTAGSGTQQRLSFAPAARQVCRRSFGAAQQLTYLSTKT